MHDAGVAVPIFFFLIVVGGPIAAWIVSRVLAHQERMEMLRRGFAPPPPTMDPKAMRKAMKYGAWPPGQPAQPGFQMPMYDPNYYAQHQLRRGIQVAFIGLALLIGLGFIGYRGGYFEPGPWLLGGLIPMFVGIAQIISAVLSGAQLGRASIPAGNPQQAQWGPAPEVEVPPTAAATGPSGPPPPPSSYGGWRPGPIPEIQKPAPPPDRL
jgi:hypothetical protein